MFSRGTIELATEVLESAQTIGVRIATVETVTAGLIAAALTSVPGASSTVERAFILYHESAKATGVGVDPALSRAHGAVSAEVTAALADGGLNHSTAGVCIAVTGYAGPDGGTEQDPVGTYYVAMARASEDTVVERYHHNGNRNAVRLNAVETALSSTLSHLKSN